ncbi:alkaline phosphatase D family protein [Micromonospora sp. WMMD882]|uniref:alkaline phosphatase D family protein n=1 Tax=Micromonospora sp. WMMD882 TaxID=3015151 RepID=UPI00248AFA1B|nr:alkaline phosphatase D family protein [Micromonospora sp. WMMD882]WBB80766.1 alkaline phosphatase D family protein [Micromonospora sp. WMMD882]
MTNTIDRRTLLRVAGASTSGAVLTAALTSVSPARAAGGAFRHGVASGDPLPDGVLLWTRVTPTDDAQPGSGVGPDTQVSWQVATDPDFTTIVGQGVTPTGPARDHTVKVEVGGLTPATTYWYRFGLAGTWSPTGRTMTAPPVDATIDRLRLGVVSCANWEAGHFSAYRHLAARGDLHLVVHLGDYLYEYGTGEFDAGGTVVRPVRPAHEILTLADYRTRHGLYKTDPDLQALHAALPWVITWDDHEVANDQWSGGAQNHTPGVEGDFAARLAAARQAYFEWMPVRAGANGAIHRRLRFGQLAELSMLDLRSYRSAQASGPAVDDPTRTITGDAQLSWLKSGLVTSTARWKLVGNPVMMARLDLATLPAWLLGPLRDLLGIPQNGAVLNPDQWDGYNADRNELVDHLRAHRTRDVVFLTGDIHCSWANEVTTRSTLLTGPAAVEFVVPSVTSDNIDDFLGLPPGNSLSALGASLIRTTNPHVRWTELDGHGYGVLEVTPQQCRMDWYHLADRTSATSGSSWVAGWSVAAGSARLRPESGPLT